MHLFYLVYFHQRTSKMCQAIEIAKQSLIEMQRQLSELKTSHEAKKNEIVNASQGVTGSVLLKSLHSLTIEEARYEREVQSINSKMMKIKNDIERMK
jgi:hypothetical protein